MIHSFYTFLLNTYYEVVQEAVNKAGKIIPALWSLHFRDEAGYKLIKYIYVRWLSMLGIKIKYSKLGKKK